jgi:hypothetical protein
MEDFRKLKKLKPTLAWSKRSLHKELKTNGFIYLTKQDEVNLDGLIKALGTVILSTDVKASKKSRSLVNSFDSLSLHTDHHKARYIIWYCYENSISGGESILLDGMRIFNTLSKGCQEELKEIQLMEHKVFPDDHESHPIIQESDNGDFALYYSLWMTNPEDRNKIGFLNFKQKIETSQPISLKLKKDEILIIDNQRMLHGRTEIGANESRYLKRFWIANK